MIKINNARTVMVDIDDSVLLWNPELYPHSPNDIITLEEGGRLHQFIPHTKNIEFIKKLKLQGYGLIFWSAGGNDWCERIVKELKLEDIADICMSKPEFAIDDLLDAKRIIKTVLWIDPVTGEYKRNE
jgi:hypothetical protein